MSSPLTYGSLICYLSLWRSGRGLSGISGQNICPEKKPL